MSEETLEATTLEILEYGRRMTAIDLLASLDKVNTLSRSTGRFFETCDVWLSPVTVSPPIELGVLDANAKGVDGQAWFEKIFSYGAFTTIFNATGQPAMSMPLCWSGDGLPIGIQFAAGLGREDILFQLAGQLERARPWRDKRPPLSIWSFPFTHLPAPPTVLDIVCRLFLVKKKKKTQYQRHTAIYSYAEHT